jgi:hypothetical protein
MHSVIVWFLALALALGNSSRAHEREHGQNVRRAMPAHGVGTLAWSHVHEYGPEPPWLMPTEIVPDAGHGTIRFGHSGGLSTTISGGDGVCGVQSSCETVPSQTDMIGRPRHGRPMSSEQPTRNVSPGVQSKLPPRSAPLLQPVLATITRSQRAPIC